MSAKRYLALLAISVVGCSQMTQPEDVIVAEEACVTRGGWTHVARNERGRYITVNCKDGSHFEIRLGETK